MKNRTGSKPNLVLSEEDLDEVDRFNYLDTWITPGSRIPEEAFSR